MFWIVLEHHTGATGFQDTARVVGPFVSADRAHDYAQGGSLPYTVRRLHEPEDR